MAACHAFPISTLLPALPPRDGPMPCALLPAEYCSRGSLYDCLATAREHATAAEQLTWRRRLAMAVDAGAGLLYLHSLSIIHRDGAGLRLPVASLQLPMRGSRVQCDSPRVSCASCMRCMHATSSEQVLPPLPFCSQEPEHARG